MKIRIAFDDTPLSEAVDLETLIIQHETERQRYALEEALKELGKGNLDAVREWVKKMKGETTPSSELKDIIINSLTP